MSGPFSLGSSTGVTRSGENDFGYIGSAEAAAAAAAAAQAAAEAAAAAADMDAAAADADAATASASASAASASASSASSSASSAAASYDSFDDRYLGAKSSDPTLDNDGDALSAGLLYFNLSASEMRVYDGAAWVTIAPSALVTSVDGAVGNVIVDAAKPSVDKPALSALDTTKRSIAVCNSSIWLWTPGDYSAQHAADTGEGIYLKADAIASTAGSWVRDLRDSVVFPEDFGADGTAAGDTLALQRAIDFAAANGYLVRLRRRKYLLNAALKIRDKTAIAGGGWSAEYNASVQVAKGCVLELQAGANCNVIEQDSPTYRESFYIRDVAIAGGGTNQSSLGNTPDGATGFYQFGRAGLYVQAAYNAKLVNVRIENTRGSGIDVYGDASGVTNLFLESCSGYNNRVYNVAIGGNATDVRFSGQGDWGFGRCGGIRLGTSCTLKDQTIWTSQCQDPADANTHINGTGAVADTQAGVIVAGNNGKVQSCRSEGHAGHGIKILDGVNAPQILNNTIYAVSSTVATTGLYDGISVGGSGSNVTRPAVLGNDIRASLGGTTRLRRAMTFDNHASALVFGNQCRAIGLAGAWVTGEEVVRGINPVDAQTDWSWILTQIAAHQASTQTFTTVTTIAYATETTDADAEWDNSAYTFTPLHTGPYDIMASLLFTPGADAMTASLALHDASAEVIRLAQHVVGGTGNCLLAGSVRVNLTKGVAYRIRGVFSSSSTTIVGSTFSYVKIRRAAG